MKKVLVCLILAFLFLIGCSTNKNENQILFSPDKKIEVHFSLLDGKPNYCIFYENEKIIDNSSLGFKLKNSEDLLEDFTISNIKRESFDENWKPVWGQFSEIRNNYHELSFLLTGRQNKSNKLQLWFKAYDDGIGFRYEIQGHEGDSIEIMSEETEFNFIGNYTAWWIPNDYDSYELLYNTTPLKNVDAVNTPITMKSENGVYLSIHEANLTDYAGMTLKANNSRTNGFKSELVPWPDGVKVKGIYPLITPWRTIQISKRAGGLAESNLIQNLNEPCVLDDVSWITTGKYVGIWWGMHINKNTWFVGPDHGATTENAKELIDFAAKHDIKALLIEGWNVGWESWLTGNNIQDYCKPYPDMDYEEVVKYGKKYGVDIIGHHESGGNVPMYSAQLEDAFKYCNDLGIPAVKTGYAGKMHPDGQFHHGQWNVRHYRDVVKIAAKYEVMIDAHEPIKATGISRTYPNMMTREGARGMEYNAWSEGNPPDHTTIIPFTRLLGGPMDYTPGIFDITFDKYKQGYRVYTTLAKQLAYYVTLYSPWQMAADLLENYEGNPAFDFIDAVYADWDETKIIDAEIGDYIITARRHNDEWFIGAQTDENGRDFDISLDFLGKDIEYVAHIFTDAIDTDWETNPTKIEIDKYLVTGKDIIKTVLSPAGGQAIHFYPNKGEDRANIEVFNNTAGDRIKAYKKVRKFGFSKVINHKAKGKEITLKDEYSSQYTGGNRNALVDGFYGNPSKDNYWQGFEKKDLSAVINLGSLEEISEISISVLQNLTSWIFPPKTIVYSFSTDGKTYTNIAEFSPEIIRDNNSIIIKDYGKKFDKVNAQYVKVYAKNVGICPDWHTGAGEKAWLFVDEIIVR